MVRSTGGRARKAFGSYMNAYRTLIMSLVAIGTLAGFPLGGIIREHAGNFLTRRHAAILDAHNAYRRKHCVPDLT